jgi:ribonuclease HI
MLYQSKLLGSSLIYSLSHPKEIESSMSDFILMTDGSVDTQKRIGYGAFLLLPSEQNTRSVAELAEKVQLRRFEQTSSTRLELQTLLWAFDQLPEEINQLKVYTDSHNIISLLQRRQRLERDNFIATSGKLLSQAELYRQFYQRIDLLNCSFIQLQGHQPDREKGVIERLFTLVDRASRRALRADRLK